MKKYILLAFVFFLFSKGYAQQDLALTMSLEICKCLSTSKSFTKADYNKCYADCFIKHQKQIAQEYQLNEKSTYEQSKAAGQKMRARVETYLQKNCSDAKKFK